MSFHLAVLRLAKSRGIVDRHFAFVDTSGKLGEQTASKIGFQARGSGSHGAAGEQGGTRAGRLAGSQLEARIRLRPEDVRRKTAYLHCTLNQYGEQSLPHLGETGVEGDGTGLFNDQTTHAELDGTVSETGIFYRTGNSHGASIRARVIIGVLDRQQRLLDADPFLHHLSGREDVAYAQHIAPAHLPTIDTDL